MEQDRELTSLSAIAKPLAAGLIPAQRIAAEAIDTFDHIQARIDAAARAWTFGSQTELRKLSARMLVGEDLVALVGGTYDGSAGLLALTTERLIFAREGTTGPGALQIPLVELQRIGWTSSFAFGTITIQVADKFREIRRVQKQVGQNFVAHAHTAQARAEQAAASTARNN